MKFLIYGMLAFLSTSTFASSEKIGFKGLYLNQDKIRTCNIVRGHMILTGDESIYTESNSYCGSSKIFNPLKVFFENGKVSTIIFPIEMFGFSTNESVDTIGFSIIDKVNWVNTLNASFNKQGEIEYYFENDEFKLTFTMGNTFKLESKIIKSEPVVK